jgi:uncharacterized protein HemX
MGEAMNLTLISAVVAAAIGFGAAWKIQNKRIEHAEYERMAQAQSQERELHATEQKRLNQVIDATNRATKRESKLRSDAATAESAADSLRVQSAKALLAARASHDACIERTVAYDLVLNQCSQEYQRLGEVADRHSSDLQTITEAWPK